ncbi:formylglycine-generating enzyme family protein [Peristeroidobacter agariperforans]|uniref:formylglycine-generating enzyme family protein n=1 Tax=Peristeroidobacter agariperforans TaxID=268404 RepID=UPI001E3F3BA6|nr:SUMF1/EgtB/PvdO family nonheme iron enzyme [Peristeroidobacter agariperforans]
MKKLMRHRRYLAALALMLVSLGHAESPDTPAAPAIPGGSFESVLPPAPSVKNVRIQPFRLDRTPVTNEQFATFLRTHPQWRRDRVAKVFADEQYLSHWQAPLDPGQENLRRPVVHVSWFAATAYCEAQGARLPRWHEWEYVAAASDRQRDARNDPAWRQQILSWYSRSGRGPLPAVGGTTANAFGIQDLHGVIWEWVEDAGGMLVSSDNREQSSADVMRFCGEGALTMEQKENYATLMRIAMLSSMKARYTSATMGFRCASDVRTGS